MDDKVEIANKWIAAGYAKTKVLRILKLNRSTDYYRMSTIGRIRGKAPGRSVLGYSLNKNNKKVSDEQIKEYIIQIIEDEGYTYGYLKITHALRRNFHLLINKKKVYRLCKELNLLKSQRKIKTKHPRRIARNRVVTGSNQLWQTDVKYGYVAGKGRFFYILSIIDVADRSIIAFHMGLRCTSEDAVTTLKTALLKRQLYNTDSMPILRSDNGPQYISHIFGDACKKLGVEHERIPYKTPNLELSTCRLVNIFNIYKYPMKS